MSAEKAPISYKISNLNAKFIEQGIDLQTIFTYTKRILMLEVIKETFKFFIYIPSKYEMYIDNAFRMLGIATYELIDEEDKEAGEDPDTLFYSKLPIENLRRKKNSKAKSLTRFLPLVSESPIKLIYADEYFLSYITRHNEVDSLISLSPYNKDKGYFYLTDLEFVYGNMDKLNSEFAKFEKALNKVVYDKLSVEVDSAKVSIERAQKIINTLNPKKEKDKFTEDIDNLNKYYINDKVKKERARVQMIAVRSTNLNKMFDIENITYMMKELK
jgi:hypothetical protein